MLRQVTDVCGRDIWVCDLTQIKKENAPYNIIMSGRSDGKSFAVLEEILDNKLKKGKQGAIIRRWDLDFKRGRGQTMWQNLVSEQKLKGTGWDNILFKNGCWWLAKFDKKLNTYKMDSTPLCYALALADVEHAKSSSYPEVTTVLFDEFIPLGSYLPDEFVLFSNMLSTIIRKYRRDVKVYMCANTITWDSLYFKEMGLKRIKDMKQGTINVYGYGESDLKVAVEILPPVPNVGETNSDFYFAFDNPKLAMIRGEGFEIGTHPHLPTWVQIKPCNIRRVFFIDYNDECVQGEIIHIDGNTDFLYFHTKTTPIKDENKDIIYSADCDPRRNWRRSILNPYDELGKRIYAYFQKEKVFFQDNTVGEDVMNYIKFCKNISLWG